MNGVKLVVVSHTQRNENEILHPLWEISDDESSTESSNSSGSDDRKTVIYNPRYRQFQDDLLPTADDVEFIPNEPVTTAARSKKGSTDAKTTRSQSFPSNMSEELMRENSKCIKKRKIDDLFNKTRSDLTRQIIERENEQYKSGRFNRKRKIATPKQGKNSANETVIVIDEDDAPDFGDTLREITNSNSHSAQSLFLPNAILSTSEGVKNNSKRVATNPEKKPSDSTRQTSDEVKTDQNENEAVNKNTKDSIGSLTINLMEGNAQNGKLPTKNEVEPKQHHKDVLGTGLTESDAVIVIDDDSLDPVESFSETTNQTSQSAQPSLLPSTALSISAEGMMKNNEKVEAFPEKTIPDFVNEKAEDSIRSQTINLIKGTSPEQQHKDEVNEVVQDILNDPNTHFDKTDSDWTQHLAETMTELYNRVMIKKKRKIPKEGSSLTNEIVIISDDEDTPDSIDVLRETTNLNPHLAQSSLLPNAIRSISEEVMKNSQRIETFLDKMPADLTQQTSDELKSGKSKNEAVNENGKDSNSSQVNFMEETAQNGVHAIVEYHKDEVIVTDDDSLDSVHSLCEKMNSISAQPSNLLSICEEGAIENSKSVIISSELNTMINNDDDTLDSIQNSYSDSDHSEIVSPTPSPVEALRIISKKVVIETPTRKRQWTNNRKRDIARMTSTHRIKHNFKQLPLILKTKGPITVPFHRTLPKQRSESLEATENRRNSIEDASEDVVELAVEQSAFTNSQMLNLDETYFTILQNFGSQRSRIDDDGKSPTKATNGLSPVQEAPDSYNGNTMPTTSELVPTAISIKGLNHLQQVLEPYRSAIANGNTTSKSELVSTTKDWTTIALNPVQQAPERHRLSNEHYIYVPYFILQQVTLKTRSQKNLRFKNSTQSNARILLPNNGYYKKLNILNDSLRFLFGLSNREWNCVNNLLQIVGSFEYVAKNEPLDASLADKILYFLFATLPKSSQVTLKLEEQATCPNSSENDARCVPFDTNSLRSVGSSSLINALDPYILERMKAVKKKAPVPELFSIGPVPPSANI